MTIKMSIKENPYGMTRADILKTAEQMVCGHREQDYGTPEDNFEIIAYFWGIYIRKRLKLEKQHGVNCLSAADVANMMCLFKLARITTGTGTADSYIDLAGYAACGGEIATKGGAE